MPILVRGPASDGMQNEHVHHPLGHQSCVYRSHVDSGQSDSVDIAARLCMSQRSHQSQSPSPSQEIAQVGAFLRSYRLVAVRHLFSSRHLLLLPTLAGTQDQDTDD